MHNCSNSTSGANAEMSQMTINIVKYNSALILCIYSISTETHATFAPSIQYKTA